eukprot:Ihof_evm4s351 gene=Ihof_evmTU4s351
MGYAEGGKATAFTENTLIIFYIATAIESIYNTNKSDWVASASGRHAGFFYARQLMNCGGQYKDTPTIFNTNTLGANFVGQDHVVTEVQRALRLRQKGLVRDQMAFSIALLGPPGTGKTEMARRIASALHGQPIEQLEQEGKFVVFDMTAYHDKASVQSWTGSPVGYEGESPMSTVFQAHPDAVVLLDEFEKGDCEGIPPLLLKMLDRHGRLTDKKKPQHIIPTTRATFILASNYGDHLVTPNLTIAEAKAAVWHYMETTVCPTSPNPFSAPLRSRLGHGGIHVFAPMQAQHVAEAIRLSLHRLRRRLAATVDMCWTDDFVADLHVQLKGEVSEGMRGLEVMVERQVLDLLEGQWEDLVTCRDCGFYNNSVVLDRGLDMGPVAVRVWNRLEGQQPECYGPSHNSPSTGSSVGVSDREERATPGAIQSEQSSDKQQPQLAPVPSPQPVEEPAKQLELKHLQQNLISLQLSTQLQLEKTLQLVQAMGVVAVVVSVLAGLSGLAAFSIVSQAVVAKALIGVTSVASLVLVVVLWPLLQYLWPWIKAVLVVT